MPRAPSVILRRALAGASFAAALAACRHQPKPGAPGGGAAAGGRTAPGVAQVLVPDSAGIRRYLETVDTVRGAVVDLTWSPNTVRLDRAETLRSLRRVSRTGAVFTFDAREPKVRDLKPGQVLLVWGIALRKVTAVEPRGDRIVVRTGVASLPEAIQSGTIAWKSRAALGAGLVSPAAPVPDSARRRASLVPAQGPFRVAAYRVRLGGALQEPQGEGGGQGRNEAAESDEAEEAELPHHAEGELGGYEFEVGYGTPGDRLDFQLEARKGEFTPYDKPQENAGERARAQGTRAVGGGGGGEAPEEKPLTPEEKKKAKEREELETNTKKGVGEIEHPGSALTPKGLFGIAAESFDLRVRVKGHLDDFATEGKLAIANAALGNFHLALSDLHGEADLDWVARLGRQGTFSENVKVEVPWNYDIPLIIAGIPFVIEVGVNFLAAPGLTSQYASAAGSYHIAFAGGAGITATPTDVTTESSLSGKPETKSRQVTSLGVSAVLVAAQVPRIGFGLGLLNTSAVAYVDHVLATSVVTAGGISLIPCRRYQINSSFGAGVGVQLLGIPIPGLGQKKILAQPFDEVITEPPGANCKV